MIGVASGPWKVIWDREANAWSLFSLANDPDDRNDLALAQPDRLEAMRKQLFETIDSRALDGPETADSTLSVSARLVDGFAVPLSDGHQADDTLRSWTRCPSSCCSASSRSAMASGRRGS